MEIQQRRNSSLSPQINRCLLHGCNHRVALFCQLCVGRITGFCIHTRDKLPGRVFIKMQNTSFAQPCSGLHTYCGVVLNKQFAVRKSRL